MIYCLNTRQKNNNTALGKAPADISLIAKEYGAGEVIFYDPKQYRISGLTKVMAVVTGIKNWIRLARRVKKGDLVVVQHPYENIRVAQRAIPMLKKKGVIFVSLIHDLPSLRKGMGERYTAFEEKRAKASDNALLREFDYIIAHNAAMVEYLVSEGFSRERMVSLEIFDYLSDQPMLSAQPKECSIVVAGNLEKGKCEYLYKLTDEDSGVVIHLFGREYKGNTDDNVIYHGQCAPDQLPGVLQGSFGLVWDGDAIETCGGNTGRYLRYNNPHKCSLYLASGLPVIIWKEAALAAFVEGNSVGIAIGSLLELKERIDTVSPEAYAQMRKNAAMIGQKLRAGYYTRRALDRIVSMAEVERG